MNKSELSSSDVEALRKSAVVAYRQGLFGDAIEILENAIHIDPQAAAIWELLGACRLKTKQLHEAIDAFEQATSADPQRAVGLVNIGAIYNRLGNFELAVEYLKRAIQRDRRSAEAYYNLGSAYRRLKKYDLATSAFKELIRINPLEWEAHYQLGKIARDRGMIKLEIKAYHKALEIEPGNARVKRSLENAMQNQSAERQNENPFGRLVDAQPARQMHSTVMLPGLSEDERKQDREMVRMCAIASELASNEYLESLQSFVRTTLDKLKTSIASGNHASATFLNTHQQFRTAARDLAKSRNGLQKKVAQLRQHENDVLAFLESKLG